MSIVSPGDSLKVLDVQSKYLTVEPDCYRYVCDVAAERSQDSEGRS